MVKYELTGRQAQQVIAAAQRANNPRVRIKETDETNQEELTFVVRSVSDVKAVAAYVGLDIPEGRGRFPMRRLEEALAQRGYKLDRSAYGDKVSVIPGTYQVSLMAIVGGKVYPRVGIVTGDQVREFAGGRGRPSKDAVASAAISVHGWEDTYLTDSVSVTRQD